MYRRYKYKNNFNSTCTEDINIKVILTVHVQKI